MTSDTTDDRPYARSTVKFVRMSASKVRIVLDLIRGDHVVDAIETLALSERKASHDIAKALRSAVANANHNEEIPTEELYVSACYADEGPTLKRFRPRARGRAGRVKKRTCHITVEVARMTDEEIARRSARLEAKGTAATPGADRARRVARSKKAEAVEPAIDEVATAPVDTGPGDDVEAAVESSEATLADAAIEEVDQADEPEASSSTIDSDADGQVNAADESPYGDGSHALIDEDPTIMPEGFEIKGNASSKLYHVPGSSFYKRTSPEVWFANEEAAQAAGFQKPASQREADE